MLPCKRMLVITVLLLGVMQGRGAVGVDKGIAPEASAAPSGSDSYGRYEDVRAAHATPTQGKRGPDADRETGTAMHHAKQDTPAPEASQKHLASAPAGGSSSSPDQYNYPSLKQGQHKQGQHSTSEPGSMPIRHKPHTSKDRAPSTDYHPASEQYTHKPDYYKEQVELDYPGTFKHKEPTSEHKQSSPDHEDDEPAYKPKSNTHYKPNDDEPAYEPKPYTGKHTPSQKYKPQEPRRYEPEHQDNEQEPYKPEHTQYEPEQYSLKYTDHTDDHAPSPQYTHQSDPHPHNPSKHDDYSTDHAPSTGYPPLSEQYQHTADRYKKDHGEPGLHKYDEHPSTGYHAPSAQYKPVHHPRVQPYHPSYRYYPDAMQDNLDHDYSPNSENYKQTFKPPRSHPVQHDHHAAPPVYPEPLYKLTHPYPAQPPPYQAPVYWSYRGSHDQWPYAKQYPGSPGEQYYKQYYPDEPYYKQYSPSEQYHKPAEPGPPPVITCSPGYGVASTGGVVKCERCPGETFSAGGVEAVCTQCGPYQTSPPGSTSRDFCSCKAGYGRDDSEHCAICPVGTYWPGPPSSVTVAIAASAQTAGGIQPCLNCSSITNMNDGSGFTTVTLGATSAGQCVCKPRFAGPFCSACKPSELCPGGDRSHPNNCPPNSVAPANSNDLTDCVCKPGFGTPANCNSTGAGMGGGGSIRASGRSSPASTGPVCDICPRGTFSPGGTPEHPADSCKPCPDNGDSPPGSISQDNCTFVPPPLPPEAICIPANQPTAEVPNTVLNVLAVQKSFSWSNVSSMHASQGASAHGVDETTRKKPHPAARTAPTQVEASAVTNPEFQLPINPDGPTNVGFWGKVDRPALETRDDGIPPDQALMVGPGPTGSVYVVHVINKIMSIYTVSESTGWQTLLGSASLDKIIQNSGFQLPLLRSPQSPVGYFDLDKQRFIVAWRSSPNSPLLSPRLFFAISETSDPTGDWVIKTLIVDTPCDNFPGDRTPFFEDPQVTYDESGVYYTVRLQCGDDTRESGIFAVSKEKLYANDAEPILAAVYTLATVQASVPAANLLSRKLDTYIMPALPQDSADVSRPPLFALSQEERTFEPPSSFPPSLTPPGGILGVITLEGDITAMTTVNNAPKLRAQLLENGFEFPQSTVVAAVMPQPLMTSPELKAGDVVSNNGAIRTYGTVQNNRVLYLTLTRWYGDTTDANSDSEEDAIVPAIYWAFIEIGTTDLCNITRTAAGVVTSEQQDPPQPSDKLAFAYPTIAAIPGGGARVVYAFSGAGELPNMVPAYAGVASTNIGAGGDISSSSVDIIKIGDGILEATQVLMDSRFCQGALCEWGRYSAVSVWDNKMWTATTAAYNIDDSLGVDVVPGSWITWDDLAA